MQGQSDTKVLGSQSGVEELWEPGEGASEPNRGWRGLQGGSEVT